MNVIFEKLVKNIYYSYIGNVIVFWNADTLDIAYILNTNQSKESLISLINTYRSWNNHAISDDNNLLIRFLLTNLCNLNCDYCQMKKGIGKQKWSGKIDNKVIDKVLVSCLNRQYDHVTIHFSGGEPLLCLDQITYICEKAQSLYGADLRFAMSTNGTLLTEKAISIINKYKIKTVISIDGFGLLNSHRRDNTGKETIDTVISGYESLKKAGADVGLSIVATQLNMKDMDDIMKKITSEMSPASIGLNYLHYPGFDRELAINMSELDLYEYAKTLYDVYEVCGNHNIFEEQSNRIMEPLVFQKHRTMHCSSQKSQITVSPTGDISPCKTFLTRGKDTLENIKWNDLHDIENSIEFKSWRNRHVDNIEKCKECYVKYLCGGGCGYEAFVETNNILNHSNRYCIVPQYFLSRTIEKLYQNESFKYADNELKIVPYEEKLKLLSVQSPNKLELSTSIGHILE